MIDCIVLNRSTLQQTSEQVMEFTDIKAIESKIAKSFKAAGKDCVVIFNRVPAKTLDKAANLFNLKNNKLQAIVISEPPPDMPEAIGIAVFIIGSELHRDWLNRSILNQ